MNTHDWVLVNSGGSGWDWKFRRIRKNKTVAASNASRVVRSAWSWARDPVKAAEYEKGAGK